MRDLVYLGRRQGVGFGGLVAIILVVATGCGGQLADDGTGTGGGTTIGANTSPTTTAVTPNTTNRVIDNQTLCFGVVPNAAAPFTPGMTSTVGPVDKNATSCVFAVPMAPHLRLVPSLLKLYFDADSKGKLEIPYVGAVESCPVSGTTGGWYKTEVPGGSSSVGLCDCTCRAAKKYAVTVAIAKEGMPH